MLLDRIEKIELRWRLLFVIVVQLIYMVASRIIEREADSFAEEEILRTPWRIGAAILFWIAMRDVLTRPVRRPETLRSRPFLIGLAFMMAAPALAFDHQLPAYDEFILAVTAIPVGFAEELFARGIVQTLCVARWGAWRGVAISTGVFTAYHLGVAPGGEFILNYVSIALGGLLFGLIYLKSGSLLAVIILHDLYDALISLPRVFGAASEDLGIILEAIAVLYLLIWTTSKKDPLAKF